jgi:hypothetical protein
MQSSGTAKYPTGRVTAPTEKALSETQLRELIERLAAIHRPSASPGEAQAARLIANELEATGAAARVEAERAHGTYWWPVGLLTAAAGLAGRFGGRLGGLVAGALATAAMIDDIAGGRQWFRRRLLPARETTNVVAEVGRGDAPRTVLVIAHHDAAHPGVVFHPELPRTIARRFPKLWERQETTPGTMWGAVAGPALIALGGLTGSRHLRRAGIALCAGYTAAMADIGVRSAVPGANDNLSGVAVLVSLARSLADAPVDGVRVVLLSTGSEESFMEGMQAYARRHFDSFDRDRTDVICVDTVGSTTLLALEGEGMVWMNEYPKDLIALAKRAAGELGIELFPNLRLRNATDGLVALRAGFPTLALASVDEYKVPANYHWPTDVPENVDYGSVADCGRLVRRVVELLASR